MKTVTKTLRVLDGDSFIEKEFTKHLIENEEDFDLMKDQIKDAISISFDTENGNGDLVDGALNPRFAVPAGYSVSIDGKVGYYIPINHPDIKTELHLRFHELLINRKMIIFWNAIYDGSITTQSYGNDLYKYVWYDCMIAQHLLDAFQGKGLKRNTERYFGIKQGKFEWKDACKSNAEDIFEYACDDAIYTHMHYLRTKVPIKEQGLGNLLLNIEGEFLKVLSNIKLNGISFDVEKAKELEIRLLEDRRILMEKILECTPEISYINSLIGEKIISINLDSGKHLTKLIYDKLNIPVTNTTKSGGPATDTDAFKLMKSKKGMWLHPIIPLLIKYKEVQKLLSAYTSSLYNKAVGGRIYGDLLDHGTESGRLSAKNPNLQQLPNEELEIDERLEKFNQIKDKDEREFFISHFTEPYNVRSLFRCSEDYTMMVSDFGQEELRVAGVLTKSPAFKEAFDRGQDLHLKVANECYNLNIPDECLVESHPDYKTYKNKHYKARFNSKSINFGLLYGRTAHGLAPQLGCSVGEAQEIVDNYFKTFPDVKKAMDATSKEIKVRGFVCNLYNRRRRFNKIINIWTKKLEYSSSALRQGFNHKIQGSCADILRIVMVEVYKYIRDQPKDQIRMLTTIHDEIVFEIKDDKDLNMHAEKLDYIMQNTVKLPIKLKTDYSLGRNYGEAK